MMHRNELVQWAVTDAVKEYVEECSFWEPSHPTGGIMLCFVDIGGAIQVNLGLNQARYRFVISEFHTISSIRHQTKTATRHVLDHKEHHHPI